MRLKYASLAGLLLALAAGVAGPMAGQTAGNKIGYREVSYEELGRIVRGLKGKVVVVDFWADY